MSACLSEMNVCWTDGMSLDPVVEFIGHYCVCFWLLFEMAGSGKMVQFLEVSLSNCYLYV